MSSSSTGTGRYSYPSFQATGLRYNPGALYADYQSEHLFSNPTAAVYQTSGVTNIHESQNLVHRPPALENDTGAIYAVQLPVHSEEAVSIARSLGMPGDTPPPSYLEVSISTPPPTYARVAIVIHVGQNQLTVSENPLATHNPSQNNTSQGRSPEIPLTAPPAYSRSRTLVADFGSGLIIWEPSDNFRPPNIWQGEDSPSNLTAQQEIPTNNSIVVQERQDIPDRVHRRRQPRH